MIVVDHLSPWDRDRPGWFGWLVVAALVFTVAAAALWLGGTK